MAAPVYTQLEKAYEPLKAGKVGIIPTDTTYGIVAVASDEKAVEELYSIKKREAKPGTIIAASIEQLVELGLKKRYLTAVEQYWPGSISVVIPTGPSLPYLHRGKYSLAVRIPKDATLQSLLQKTGPLLTNSANSPGKTPATTIAEAKNYFGDEVSFYVDGDTLSTTPSTLIRVVDDAVEVLREGSVKIDEETGKIL